MVILGIDPGTATTGFGVIDARAGALTHLEYGTIDTSPRMPLHRRLFRIYEGITEIMERHAPDVIAVEQLFFNRNVTSAFAVGHARGMSLLAAAQRGLDVVEYTPNQVKQGITGNGAADKAQVQFMVRALLRLDHFPRPDDAADALAIAICHAHSHAATTRIASAMERDRGGNAL